MPPPFEEWWKGEYSVTPVCLSICLSPSASGVSSLRLIGGRGVEGGPLDTFLVALQVAPILSSFHVNWIYGSGKEGQCRFSRWWASWISNWNDFSYYFIYKLPRYFPPSFESIGLLVQEKKHKIAFQDGGHRGYLIGMTLAVFDPQVALILPTKFQVN